MRFRVIKGKLGAPLQIRCASKKLKRDEEFYLPFVHDIVKHSHDFYSVNYKGKRMGVFKTLEKAKKLCNKIEYWSKWPVGDERHGMTEFQYLVENIVPFADDLKKQLTEGLE